MKNLFKVLAFTLAMFAGVSTMQAQQLSQTQDRPEVIAKTKVAELSPKLELTGDQQRSMFRAMVANESNYKKHLAGKDLSDPAVAANKKKFDDVLETSMKKLLSPKQYAKWLTLREQ